MTHSLFFHSLGTWIPNPALVSPLQQQNQGEVNERKRKKRILLFFSSTIFSVVLIIQKLWSRFVWDIQDTYWNWAIFLQLFIVPVIYSFARVPGVYSFLSTSP